MIYFNKDFLKFFKELAANNNRDWFNDNKKRYVESVKEPFAFFVEEMLKKSAKIIPGTDKVDPKHCIFRIYRDVRFAKDKTPYQLHASAIISAKGRKDMSSTGMYVQFSAEDARMYSGVYGPSKEQLFGIRTAISTDLKGFQKLYKSKKFKDNFKEILGEKNKRLAKEFQEAAEKEPLVFNKGFYYFKKFPANIVIKEGLDKELLKTYKTSIPMNEFLEKSMK